MLKAIIFDFDGTILDTETPDYHSWQAVFAEHGSELEHEVWGQVIGTTWELFNPFDYLESKLGRKVDREKLQEIHRANFHKMILDQAALPGVESALATAQELGLRLGVATSSTRDWVEGHLERLGLLQHFEVIKTADDVEKVKPDPALYTQVLKALAIEPDEAIAFEDSVNGVKAAKAAGIFCVAVPNSVTMHMDFQHADHRVERLSDFDIQSFLNQLG